VIIFYTVSYAKKSDFEISANLEAAANVPVIDLKEKRFFISIKGHYPEAGPYFGMEHKFFTPKFYIVKEDPNSEVA
jgi:hypothetical protein